MDNTGEGSEDIAQRVSRLEAQMRELTRRFSVEDAPAVKPVFIPQPPVSRITLTPQSQTLPPAKQSRPALSLEQLLGGRALLAVGVLAFFLGVGFFLKYAFDNGWIGPTGRVMLGLLAGAAFMLGSEPLLRRGYTYYSEALAGLGGAVLYLSIYAAAQLFGLIPVSESFVAMVVVTVALMALAIRRDSERLAFLALAGGYITPLLNATSNPNQTALFIYLAILNSALLWIPRKTAWPRIEIAAFVWTQLYFLPAVMFHSFNTSTAQTPDLNFYLVFSTVFFAQFSMLPLLGARSGKGLAPHAIFLAGATSILYYLALHVLLYEHHRYVLSAWVVALAALYLLMAQITTARTKMLFATIALALITLGVGITCSGVTLDVLWAIEGAALLWYGLRANVPVARLFGIVAFVCCGLALYAVPPEGGALFINARFLSLSLLAAALAFIAVSARSSVELSDHEKTLYNGFALVANAVFIYALSVDLLAATHGSELALSLTWLVYAVLLVTYGLLRKSAFTRWEGLALFGLVIVKVFFVDLVTVDPIIRIVSFMATGAVLLVVAFVYQRATASSNNAAGAGHEY